MDENQLGMNIQHLRKIYGETLDELGAAVGYAKSTIKGYENGSRKPDPATLNAIAKHYRKTVDELLHTDLTDLVKVEFSANTASAMTDYIKMMLPLFSSEEAMENESFKRGYNLSQQILEAFAKGEMLRGSIIADVIQAYIAAIEETQAMEAHANLLSSIYLLWSQIADVTDIKKLVMLQSKLLSKKLDLMEIMAAKQNESVETQNMKRSFITDFEDTIDEEIQLLKSDTKWSDLGDYYLALRYVIGLADTDYSAEMNTAVGMQMMLSFAMLKNRYALTLLAKSKAF